MNKSTFPHFPNPGSPPAGIYFFPFFQQKHPQLVMEAVYDQFLTNFAAHLKKRGA
ncbi:hypothetical protein JMG10_22485 [Nostoc ellipsosporum NOK]|nr:hypothetical protein [Nostoc ellipsosporum NOK]